MRDTPRRRPVLAILTVIAGLTLGAAGVSCKTDGGKAGSSPSPSAAPTSTVTIRTGAGKVAFRVELAIKPEEHERGLMFRRHLDEDAGMLFVSESPRLQVFWMKNTFIPLDMIFVGADRRIVGIVEYAEPLTETARRVDAPSQYVLEIGAGLSAKHGIRAGQQLEFQSVPTTAP